MLTASTQLLFIDEWSADKKQFDQCKIVFQGGNQVIPQKCRLPANFRYQSGVYITINEVRVKSQWSHKFALTIIFYLWTDDGDLKFHSQDPKFPPDEHGNAMKKRIQRFKCLPINPVVRNMEVLYRKQTMEIIHWMTNELKVIWYISYYQFSRFALALQWPLHTLHRLTILSGYGSLWESHQ